MSVRRLAPAEIQPASFAFSEENGRWSEGEIAKYPEGRQASAVIPLLWQAQKQHGWLPKPAIEAVAVQLGMPIIRVMEVATFYTMFNLEPVGRWFVQLCGTVPCHVKGALDLKQVLLEKVGDERHVTPDGNFSWLEVECLGACCNAPMVQINDDYYEDLTPDLLIGLLDDLAAGREVKPGPQAGRRSSEPEGEVKTLQDEALFDGSLVGAWRKRFEASTPKTSEAPAATATGDNDPKPGRPAANRPAQSSAADGPAQRAADGKEPIPQAAQDRADDSSKTSAVFPGSSSNPNPPQSSKSYVMTPSKPEDGRAAAGSLGTTPVSGAPGEGEPARRDGSDTKPVGADKDASPGVAPKE
ncbi:NADH-quinone oxidoreductase subunit NuoE [uncultured Enterovirga sp.]|uniref:NADH-quinone oxidoreductase subunit NuoE n=1 Tax=uncultured Enterovirga sp. TaxID=2026352 RepID=UPI0035CA7900